MEWSSSKPLSQADERCVFGLSLETLFLTPILLMLPHRHPLLAIACFMLSTKVHPAPLCPGTDHRACKIPQACTPASGAHTELATRASRQANPAVAWPPVFKCLIRSMLPS